MVELVDTQDLKSCDLTVVRVQVPSRVQIQKINPCNSDNYKGFVFLGDYIGDIKIDLKIAYLASMKWHILFSLSIFALIFDAMSAL